MVCTRADHAHRNEVPTPPPAGRAGTQNRSLARDLARWLGQTAGLLRGHGAPIEEVTGSAMAATREGNTPAQLTARAAIPTTNATRRVRPGGERTAWRKVRLGSSSAGCPTAALVDTIFRPIFFFKAPLRKPRTLWACHWVAAMSCFSVAPPGRCSSSRTRPVLPRLSVAAGFWIRLARLPDFAFGDKTKRRCAAVRG